MLTQSPELHIPAESEFLLTLPERADDYGSFSTPRERWFFIRDLQRCEVSMGAYAFPIFDLTPLEAERALAAAAPTDIAGAADALFSAAARQHGASRWADKTPHYVRCIGWLAEAFPEAQFVHMIRDGRDVARSRVQAGFTPSLRRSAAHWRDEVRQGRRAGGALPPSRYREVFYEDLIRTPKAALQELCGWLGVPFTEAMLHFHRDTEASVPDAHAHLHERTAQPVDPSRAQAWRRSLSAREVADIEAVAGDVLADLGYTLTGHRVPLWLRAARAAGAPLLRAAKRALDRAV
jgi:hypothetical protein